jgi:hypothetical protein
MLLCSSLMKFVGHVQVYIGKSFCKKWLLGYAINNLHILTLILMVDNMIKHNMNHFSGNRLKYFCWYGFLKMDFSLHLTSKVIPSMLYSYQKSILAKPINDSVYFSVPAL